jgi:hypothetical protein
MGRRICRGYFRSTLIIRRSIKNQVSSIKIGAGELDKYAQIYGLEDINRASLFFKWSLELYNKIKCSG